MTPLARNLLIGAGALVTGALIFFTPSFFMGAAPDIGPDGGVIYFVGIPDASTDPDDTRIPIPVTCAPILMNCTVATDVAYREWLLPIYHCDAGVNRLPGLRAALIMSRGDCNVVVGGCIAFPALCPSASTVNDGGYVPFFERPTFSCACAAVDPDAGGCYFIADGGLVTTGTYRLAAVDGGGCIPRPCFELSGFSGAPPGCAP